MTASYISKHHSGGWRFTYHVPANLRGVAGKNKRGQPLRAFKRYIRRCPRTEAEALARKWAVECATTLAAYRSMSENEREDFAKAGGMPAVGTFVGDDDEPVTPQQKEAEKKHNQLVVKAQMWRQTIKDVAAPEAHDLSWDRLFSEWVRIKQPKRNRPCDQTRRVCKEFFGERNLTELTSAEIGRFRDNFQCSRKMMAKHLRQIRSMIAAASHEHSSPFHEMRNPAEGVKLLGKAEPKNGGRNRTFTAQQVRTILETAERVKWGAKRHKEVLWMLRLLAFTGARPNEIGQLTGNDVREENGIKFIRIQETDATGKLHEGKSVKTEKGVRDVPLHPDVVEFFEHSKQFGRDEFIFGAFPPDKNNGRAGWLTSFFHRFLVRDCKIVEEGKDLTLYSLRHRFHDAMDEIDMPEKLQRRLTGHALDVHGSYGGRQLEVLAGWMAKIKPMG